MKKLILTLFFIMIVFLASAQVIGKIKDIDGNEYPTVIIGKQEWMIKNLRTTKLNDGTEIPWIKDNTQWSITYKPAYTWYSNDRGSYSLLYGALYNWFAVGTEKLCPLDWHVATDVEWSELTKYLGGKTIAGGKMKVVGEERKEMEQISSKQLEMDQPTYVPDSQKESKANAADLKVSLWNSPNTGATNESGFTALPGGRRHNDNESGVFAAIGSHGFWWTATESSPGVAWFRLLYFDNSHISRMAVGKTAGHSVRCVKNRTVL